MTSSTGVEHGHLSVMKCACRLLHAFERRSSPSQHCSVVCKVKLVIGKIVAKKN